MDKNMMKIAVVAIVVVVIVAAAAYVFTNDDKDDEGDYSGTALPVYGNADLDNDIDSDDQSIIEKIVAGDDGYTIDKYPWADANHDGTIDNADLNLVKKIIAGESCTVYHLNYYNDGAVNVKSKVVDTKWPVKEFIITYNSCIFAASILGVDKQITGATAVGSTYLDKYMYASVCDNAMAVSNSYDSSWNSILDTSSVSKVMIAHPDTTMVLASAYGNYDTYNEADIEKINCDVVRISESNPSREESIASVLLLGFLTGSLEKATEVAELYEKIWDSIEEKAASIADDSKLGFIIGTGSQTMAGTGNQHNYKAVLAGGSSVLGEANQAVGTWIVDDNDKIDIILDVAWSNPDNGYFFGNHEINAKTLLKAFDYEDSPYTKTTAWKEGNFYVIYGDLPVAYNILALAYVMYPDVFGDLYENSIDELLDSVSGGIFSDRDDIKFVWSLKELQEY